MYARAHAVLHVYNKPKYGKHEFAFGGLLTCAHDECLITGEIKKGKYVYYHCTHGRGHCELPWFREEEIAEELGHVLQDV
jgi:site-specific DNA recombinase